MKLRLQVRGRGGVFRNSVAGAVATAADFAVVSALVSWLGWSAPLATLIGSVFGGVVNFGINRSWSFASTGQIRGMAARYLVVSAVSAALNALGVWVLSAAPRLPYQLAWMIIRGGVYLGWNYPLQKYYVFRHNGARLRSRV